MRTLPCVRGWSPGLGWLALAVTAAALLTGCQSSPRQQSAQAPTGESPSTSASSAHSNPPPPPPPPPPEQSLVIPPDSPTETKSELAPRQRAAPAKPQARPMRGGLGGSSGRSDATQYGTAKEAPKPSPTAAARAWEKQREQYTGDQYLAVYPPPRQGRAADIAHGRISISTAGSGSTATALMPQFEWPPPQPSEEYVLPAGLFDAAAAALLFADVDRVLVSALDSAGYSERNYYAVPDGFALATRIEQINDDGTPKTPPGRFALQPQPVSMLRPMAYLKALLKGVPGYYRVLVFVVTDASFSATGQRPTEGQAVAWVSAGNNVLPRPVAETPYTSDFHCTVLIYEFTRQPGADPDATQFAQPGRLDAMTHLRKSGIWSGLHGR